MTVYNPAFLIDDLRRFGLEVTVDKDGSMHVWKKAGERRMEVQGIAYFLGLVQAQLFPDASVATLIRKFVETAEKANFKHSATVDLDLDMHFN